MSRGLRGHGDRGGCKAFAGIWYVCQRTDVFSGMTTPRHQLYMGFRMKSKRQSTESKFNGLQGGKLPS